MEKSLREQKEVLMKEWEECFETSVDKVINQKGLRHFWDDNTSIDEAIELLTVAGINMLINEMIDDVVGLAIISKGTKKPEKKETQEPKESRQYKVIGYVPAQNNTFSTLEGAENFREEIARTTHRTIDELSIVQVIK